VQNFIRKQVKIAPGESYFQKQKKGRKKKEPWTPTSCSHRHKTLDADDPLCSPHQTEATGRWKGKRDTGRRGKY